MSETFYSEISDAPKTNQIETLETAVPSDLHGSIRTTKIKKGAGTGGIQHWLGRGKRENTTDFPLRNLFRRLCWKEQFLRKSLIFRPLLSLVGKLARLRPLPFPRPLPLEPEPLPEATARFPLPLDLPLSPPFPLRPG